ncbi:MAG: hypothetical protein ABEJ42_05970 [Halobacteriaceae archaeon]
MVSLAEYWPEIEPTTVVVVGIVLVVIPDPASTTLGVGITLFGLAWWVQEWRS